VNGSQLTPSEWLLAGIILFLLIVIVALIYIGRRIKRADDFAKLDAATGALNSEGLTHAAAKQLKDKSKAYAVVVMQLKNYRQLTQTFGGENGLHGLDFTGDVEGIGGEQLVIQAGKSIGNQTRSICVGNIYGDSSQHQSHTAD